MLSPGIAPDVVAMPVGQGHETFTRYASGRGANPIAILAPVAEPETGALAWAATRVKIARAGGPRRQPDHVRGRDAGTSARARGAVKAALRAQRYRAQLCSADARERKPVRA